MWVTMEWIRDILEWTDRLSSMSIGRGCMGVADTQLVPGMGVWPGGGEVEPPTASTRADMGSWNKSWVVEKVLQSRGTV